MLNIGAGEMILIAVVALLVLGPERLPQLARGLGKTVRAFRRQTEEVRTVVEREFYRMDEEVQAPMPPKLPEGQKRVARGGPSPVSAAGSAPVPAGTEPNVIAAAAPSDASPGPLDPSTARTQLLSPVSAAELAAAPGGDAPARVGPSEKEEQQG